MGILLMHAELRLVPGHVLSPPLPTDVYRPLSPVRLALNTKISYKVGASGGPALSRRVFFPRGSANYWSGDVSQFSRFYLRSSHSMKSGILTQRSMTLQKEQREANSCL